MTELEQLTPTLMALIDVGPPDIPIDVDLQEIQDLLAFVDNHPEVATALDEVGLEPAALPAIRLALPAARQAQSTWNTLRNPRKPEDQKDIEDKGRGLRTEVVAGLRFTLRTDPAVQSAVDRIVRGDGVADLTQDLEDLATLVEKHLPALARNRKLDAPRKVPALRAAAQDIRLGLAEFRTDKAQRDAIDLRNRAWTWLETQVTELRAAGRYAFLGTPSARGFRSDYERRLRLSRGRRKSDDEEDREPTDGAPTA